VSIVGSERTLELQLLPYVPHAAGTYTVTKYPNGLKSSLLSTSQNAKNAYRSINISEGITEYAAPDDCSDSNAAITTTENTKNITENTINTMENTINTVIPTENTIKATENTTNTTENTTSPMEDTINTINPVESTIKTTSNAKMDSNGHGKKVGNMSVSVLVDLLNLLSIQSLSDSEARLRGRSFVKHGPFMSDYSLFCLY